jgi:hypothetical protein
VYGFALLFLGPSVVRVRELPWQSLGWFGALIVSLVYGWFQGGLATQEHEPPGSQSEQHVQSPHFSAMSFSAIAMRR